MVSFSKVQQLSDVVETFPENLGAICLRLGIFGNFSSTLWREENRKTSAKKNYPKHVN